MSRVSHAIDRVEATFDDPNMVANAGLLLMGTLVARLELEALVNATVHLSGRVGGARPGHGVLTLVHAIAAGGSHIDHADVLRAGRGRAGQGDAQGAGGGKLLTPERRRRAVVVLQERFGVPERRACRVVGQHRSTQRLAPRPRPAEEDKLRRRLRAIARRHPRWGWTTAHVLLCREGYTVNRKRTRRLWREEGLRRPVTCKRKRTRPPSGELLRAERPNHV